MLSFCRLIKTYKTINLPTLYGCGTWFLTLREEQKFGVFENRVLTRIFGPEENSVVRSSMIFTCRQILLK